MFDFRLAEHLHKTVSEIEEMPATEYQAWKGYFVIKHREMKKAELEAKTKARAGRGRGGRGRTFEG